MDSTSEGASEREDDSGIESSVPDPTDNTIYVRIAIPDLKIQKCLQFQLDDMVWTAKQTIIQTLAKDLKDAINYGLYCPPMNGRAGKFLDEERPIRDYPLPGPIGFLEFKFKRRVYKLMQLNARKLKQLHTKANLKQFLDCVRNANVDRIHKFTLRGLDPNFHDSETKETPLTLACSLEKPRHVIIALVSGGCHLDFRTREGFTAMHRASARGNHEALKTLLDLGASPNYKDGRGLHPLYHAVCNDTNAHCVELLLHDHSYINIRDGSGSTEIHQACKYGRVQHLEHLLFYGAEMNAQNSSGNTALHVAAVNNHESCARVLLFRGAEKSIQNYANQDAWQVAVIAGNVELSDIIKSFKSDQVVPFQEIPKYNEKRRGAAPSLTTLQRSRSDPRLNLTFSRKPSSPCLSSGSYPHYSSNGNLFEPEHAGMLFRQEYDSDSPRSLSISSGGSLSVLSVGEKGFWEGRVGAKEGWFPSNCVQEVQMRRKGSKAGVDQDAILIRRQTLQQIVQADVDNAPRTVVLQKGGSGFGFVLRGAKAQSQQPSSLDFAPSPDFPALQYLDRVDRGSMADKAGLKPADFVLEINGESVVNATHEHTVQLIKRSGDTLAMKVVTVKPLSLEGMDAHMDGTRTLPIKKKALLAPPAPPKRHPHTSLTSTVAGKAKSMLDSLAELERLDRTLALYDEDAKSMGPHATTSALDAAAVRRGVDPNNKTASIRSRHSGKRLTAFELEDIFARQGDTPHDMPSPEIKPLVVLPPKAYASPAERKVARMKGRASPVNSTASLSRARSTPSLVPVPGQQQDVHAHHVTRVVIHDGIHPVDDGHVVYNPQHTDASNSGEEVLYAIPLKLGQRERHASADNALCSNSAIPRHPREPPPRPPSVNSSQSGDSIPPPPTHPPPGIPGAGELVKINVEQPTYANVSEQIAAQQALRRETAYESSFRPGVVAKLSKEPAALPPGTMPPPRLSHSASSSSSMSSSSPDHYGRPPPVSSTQMRHEQHVIRSDASNLPPAQDSMHENARRFMQDHPNAVLSSTQDDASHHPAPTSRAQYYEPEPDYETVTEAMSRSHTTHTEAIVASRQSPVPVTLRQSPVPVTHRQSPAPVVHRPTPVVSRPSPTPAISKQSPAPNAHRQSPVVAASHASQVQTPSQPPPAPVEAEVQSVKSIRESWQKKQVRKSFDETDRGVTQPLTPTSPKVEENATSAFGNAIKAAAFAREKRQEEEKRIPPAPLKKPSNAPPPPPPPPGPPPQPPQITSGTPPSSQPPTVRKVPLHIQKSLEESRQREDTHAAIMAAVARRRNLVDNENMEKMADHIENKVQKAKKIQSTVYRSGDKPKEVLSPSYGGAVKKAPTPPPKSTTTTTTTVESAVATTEVMQSAALKMEEKREEVQRPPEETKSQIASAAQTAEATNFTAMAEKARQEWLLKKTGQTLERKKKNTVKPDGTDDTDNNNANNKSCAPPPPVRQDPARNGGPGGVARGSNSGAVTSPGMGDLASIIAQKAAARQKSYESNGNGKSNGTVGNGYGNSAALGVNTNSNNRNAHSSLEHRQSVEIQGATMDSSNTETMAKRTQIFESQRVQLKKAPTSTGSKTVYRAEGPTILPPPSFGNDSPPPMVPAPPAIGSDLDVISNGHSRNGPDTMGWVINSGSRQADREYSLQNKVAQRHNVDGGVGDRGDVSTMRLVGREDIEVMPVLAADVVEMDFIPPPPFFDSPEINAIVGPASQPEDAVSMVSSLSTLSTLSSTEQDGGASSPRVSHRSNSYTINREADGLGAPPPPGFDDILEPPSSLHYGQPPAEVSGSLEFIPPPFGFDTSPPSPPDPAPVTSLRHVMRRRAYQEKSIDTWSTVDVCEWLESLQLGKLSPTFARRSIAGQQLMKMGRSELLAIGVTEVSDRMNIERAIKRAIMRR